jgi:hypothetical protein
MAAVMTLSPTFLALKLVALASMVVALGTFYWICRRFASPATAAASVLVTGVLSHVYSLTFWLHSDGFFMMICAFAILVAMQIGEGKPHKWRLALLLLLCAASVFVRWAGVLNWMLIAAVLLRGQLWPRKFEQGALLPGGEMLAVLEEGEGLVEGADNFVAQSYGLMGGATDMPPVLVRLISWGTWFSYLLWQPLRLGASWPAVWLVGTICGWIVLLVIVAAVVQGARQRNWLLLAALLYTLALSMRWTQPNARYLVPLAPLLVMGLILGTGILHQLAQARWAQRTLRALLVICIGSILLANLVLYGIDVWVMRSDRFYDRYEAGLNKSLIVAAQYLDSIGVGHGQVAINPLYENIGRRRISPTGLRGFTMLTNKAMISVPRRYLNKNLPKYRPFRFWLSEQHIQYYLEQPPVEPWRVWHFRAGRLQQYKTGEPPDDEEAGWRLFRCDGKSIPLQVDLSKRQIEYPTRVPGMGQ